ncbi:hypothetical protein [Muricoccus radiodurans]|uniref:hypothetical protein n=1 Tax=Muricoccus radiodurans TaxID=2231721 RepID=UPI003CF58E65
MVVLTVVGWAPLASAVAGAFGCTLNEATAHPCIVAGHDVGETLAVMFVMAWAAIFAFPLMLASLVGWITVWARRARPA